MTTGIYEYTSTVEALQVTPETPENEIAAFTDYRVAQWMRNACGWLVKIPGDRHSSTKWIPPETFAQHYRLREYLTEPDPKAS